MITYNMLTTCHAYRLIPVLGIRLLDMFTQDA